MAARQKIETRAKGPSTPQWWFQVFWSMNLEKMNIFWHFISISMKIHVNKKYWMQTERKSQQIAQFPL